MKKYPLRDSEIPIPENWKSEFRYSEIASFVLEDLSISAGILVKTLPHLRCVAAFTNISVLLVKMEGEQGESAVSMKGNS